MKVEFQESPGIDPWTLHKMEEGKFSPTQVRTIDNFIDIYRDGILRKWHEFVIENKIPKCETIHKLPKKGSKKSSRKGVA